jgi:acetate kinase
LSAVVVTVNAGSSSLKFAVFALPGLEQRGRGQIERVGADAVLSVVGEAPRPVSAPDLGAAFGVLEAWLAERAANWRLAAFAHRVVHGGDKFIAPVIVDDGDLLALETYNTFAPLHQPANLDGIRRLSALHRGAPQVACFDTAFHANAPRVAQAFALPQRFYDEGLRRYGFHGLSYQFVAEHLERARPDLARGRVIAAHLGSGASLCAMRAGRSVGTTMGLTALDGVPMATRPGAIDAGLVLHMVREMGVEAVELMFYRDAGLKGVSGLSGDMRVLRASTAPAARFAVELFVERVAQAVAALTVPAGGIDALVLTGGIGAYDDETRREVLARLGHLGPFEALAFETDEEIVMAQAAKGLLGAF